MKWKSFTGLLLVLLLAVLACQSSPTPEPTVTPDRTAEAKEAAEAATQAAVEAEGTAEAEAAAATEVAVETELAGQAATEAVRTQQASDRVATQEAAVEQAKIEATSQAQSMVDTVQELFDQGHVDRTAGTYSSLPEFDESWPQINWYQLWFLGMDPTDFVIRADASWDSASNSANWFNSGCGFVYRLQEDDHYLAYLGLDGYVNFQRKYNDNYKLMGRYRYGLVGTPSGGAELMLVVNGGTFTFFVNGERVGTQYDTAIANGDLAYTLVSGTNAGFGTRCQLTNVELWEIAPLE